jgi:hypothetical protein
MAMLPSIAQDKWGEVTPEALKVKTYQEFPDADAVILVKNGYLSPQEGRIGYEFVKAHYVRIHILNEEGAEHADQTIYYYTKDNMERIGNYKARTINLEGEELVKIPLKK